VGNVVEKLVVKSALIPAFSPGEKEKRSPRHSAIQRRIRKTVVGIFCTWPKLFPLPGKRVRVRAGVKYKSNSQFLISRYHAPMHWLQTLDTNLFLFVNRSLVNPFFDWLMPVLSGGGEMKIFLLAAAIAAGIALLCLGKQRARLCVLMLALVIPTNDGLICNTIKHAVARPRPFVTLPQARVFGQVGKGYVPQQVGENDMVTNKGNHNSMPSGHAANIFAATMVLFLFYRRSLWFMLPLALGVAFSRVYNGVHYPSDVLAGAILGAGYAAAAAVALEAAWQRFGKNYFPRWHEKVPSLVPDLNFGNCKIR
jgi:undecaprenyl-diphosphatase